MADRLRQEEQEQDKRPGGEREGDKGVAKEPKPTKQKSPPLPGVDVSPVKPIAAPERPPGVDAPAYVLVPRADVGHPVPADDVETLPRPVGYIADKVLLLWEVTRNALRSWDLLPKASAPRTTRMPAVEVVPSLPGGVIPPPAVRTDQGAATAAGQLLWRHPDPCGLQEGV